MSVFYCGSRDLHIPLPPPPHYHPRITELFMVPTIYSLALSYSVFRHLLQRWQSSTSLCSHFPGRVQLLRAGVLFQCFVQMQHHGRSGRLTKAPSHFCFTTKQNHLGASVVGRGAGVALGAGSEWVDCFNTGDVWCPGGKEIF